jgi:CheY-like chemotaxis protein
MRALGVGRRRARPANAVVLDLGLPDMDGVEVIEGLRGWTEAPMLVLSALVDRRGRGGDQRGVLTEVVPAYRVGAASVRIGVAGLATGGDHDHQQEDDGRRHPQARLSSASPPSPRTIRICSVA